MSNDPSSRKDLHGDEVYDMICLLYNMIEGFK